MRWQGAKELWRQDGIQAAGTAHAKAQTADTLEGHSLPCWWCNTREARGKTWRLKHSERLMAATNSYKQLPTRKHTCRSN